MKLRLDLHPKHRASWHVPTAELALARQARRRRRAGAAILTLVLGWLFLADPLGLDQIAAFALLAGAMLVVVALARRRRRGAGLFVATAVLLMAAGTSREVLLRNGRLACMRAYRSAATGAARQTVLGLAPYDGIRRWLIEGRRPPLCGELIGRGRGP